MTKVKIMLNEVTKIKQFNDVANRYSENIDVLSNHYIIDAKSLMGLYSLDLSKPVETYIHTEDVDKTNQFLNDIKVFLA